jgi:Ca-activated chloride channel family protein
VSRRAAGVALALGLAWVAPGALAQAGQLVPTSTGVQDPKVLSLREMSIDVGIARGYARVNVRQVFENHTARIQEGTYRFALPPSAAVGDFAVWDGLVRIPGVILEKQRARAIYRDLTAQRVDPGLLQQGEEEDEGSGEAPRPSSGALFSVSVAPIPPHATKRLELQFQQEVPFLSRQGEFRLALRPPSGAPPVAGLLEVRVRVEDADVRSSPDSLPLEQDGAVARFSRRDVVLDRDLVVRLAARDATPLRLTAFRNPDGRLPDGLALAPWERPGDVPLEKDGFFLIEMLGPGVAPEARESAPGRGPVRLAILFDTSLSHRFSGLEASYAHLVRALEMLRPDDRFALMPYDRTPADAALAPATPAAIEAALLALRERPLSPGADLVAAIAAARRLAGPDGRLLLLTDGYGAPPSKRLAEARGGLPLFTAAGAEAGEALKSASTRLLAPNATSLEAEVFFDALTAAAAAGPAPRAAGPPFSTSARVRDVYPVLTQPPAPGALSGWIGRYAEPQPGVRFDLASALLPEPQRRLEAALPERALEARDLPRRWARARVDHLLALIEAEGERRDWVDEIVALSKRYKFVTPYTAFLAAPRSLLRPRRIQPGDPVLRVECDPGIVSAVALFPFGLRLPLVKRPGTTTWEGRFLVPTGLKDGRYEVRVLLRDRGGARISERKSFVLDGRAPEVRPEPLGPARAGELVRVAVRTDADVVLLSARLQGQAPVPLRWDAASGRSVGSLRVPASLRGAHELLFEAVDGAKNRSFARSVLEVRP